jgi:hypothetical protein
MKAGIVSAQAIAQGQKIGEVFMDNLFYFGMIDSYGGSVDEQNLADFVIIQTLQKNTLSNHPG